MNEEQALAKMVPPAGNRPNKPYLGGVVQIHVTRACDKSCFGCTQGSQLAGKTTFMSPEQFAQALESLRGYWGVVGLFGGNPAVSPMFRQYCAILRDSWVPKHQRGIWCNNPMTVENARIMRETFNPQYSNLNVHLDREAYRMFKEGWPECHPVGLDTDSRHSPPLVAMKDIIEDEKERWRLISSCDINQQWSAMIGLFRGQLRAWFCEVAGAQSILHQDEPDYPDTGIDPTQNFDRWGNDGPHEMVRWWQLPMYAFRNQVRKHCHECGIPLRGHGELAQADSDPLDGRENNRREQTSETHRRVFRPKRKGRAVELVTVQEQLGARLSSVVRYLQNSKV